MFTHVHVLHHVREIISSAVPELAIGHGRGSRLFNASSGEQKGYLAEKYAS